MSLVLQVGRLARAIDLTPENFSVTKQLRRTGSTQDCITSKEETFRTQPTGATWLACSSNFRKFGGKFYVPSRLLNIFPM
jgi:hypothetical protein